MDKFLTNTDETGRFIVTSKRTGKKYFVEPIIPRNWEKRTWGSVDPATGDLMHKKGDGKFLGAVAAKDSLINEANGFKNIITLDPGVSPFHAIDTIDAKYPSVED